MIKIRLSGTEKEIRNAVKNIKDNFNIISISKDYSNRDNKTIRVYIDCD